VENHPSRWGETKLAKIAFTHTREIKARNHLVWGKKTGIKTIEPNMRISAIPKPIINKCLLLIFRVARREKSWTILKRDHKDINSPIRDSLTPRNKA